MSTSAAAVDSTSSAAETWLETHGLPNSREEAWKYTPIDQLAARLKVTDAAPVETIDSQTVDRLAGDLGGHRLVFVNGQYAPSLTRGSNGSGLWRGATTEAESAGDPDDLLRYDGYQALNQMGDSDTALVRIDPGAQITEPIHIVHVTTPVDESVIVQPRTIVQAGEASHGNIIETYVSTTGEVFTNAVSTLSLAARSHISHVRIQTEGSEAFHVGFTRVDQEAASRFDSVSVMLGAKIARNALDLTFHGAEADAKLDGLYLPVGNQRHDNILTVDHAASRCESNQQFKGVIGGKARGSFGGHIIVRENTVGTNADQSNRNLLLSPTAQADTRPWLEIFADDVRCTHGATVGRLDDMALFYLRSRAIPLVEARAMLIAAFVHEISDRIEPASLREHLLASIDSRIGANQ